MKYKLNRYLRDSCLVGKNDTFLLAVSGGPDSMVMLNLFQKLPYSFMAAHCNFGLRGDESTEDEQFVTSYCKEHNIKIFAKQFPAKKHARQTRQSTQLAARELRYAWFEETRAANNLSLIATAHHADDQVETFFINLLRNSGLSGLRGMLPRHGNIIKPLLWASREEIIAFARTHNIPFRTDSSNAETHYLRNKIRHQLIPAINVVHKDSRSVILHTMSNLRNEEVLLERYKAEITAALTRKHTESFEIDLTALCQYPGNDSLLFSIIKPFGFNASQARDITAAPGNQAGRLFFSKTHRAVVSNAKLIIETNDTPAKNIISIGQEALVTGRAPYSIASTAGMLTFECLPAGELVLSKEPGCAQLDYDRLVFPLLIREWQQGDYFYPFGLRGKKRLSDYFTDLKLSLFEKERALLVTSGDKICWVAGHRIDERFKITGKTKTVLRIRLVSP